MIDEQCGDEYCGLSWLYEGLLREAFYFSGYVDE